MAIKKKPDAAKETSTKQSNGGAKLTEEPNNNNNNNNNDNDNTLTSLASSGSGRGQQPAEPAPTLAHERQQTQQQQQQAAGESSSSAEMQNDSDEGGEAAAGATRRQGEPQHQLVIELAPQDDSPGAKENGADDKRTVADATENQVANELARRSPQQEAGVATSTDEPKGDTDNAETLRNDNEAHNVNHSEHEATNNQQKKKNNNNNNKINSNSNANNINSNQILVNSNKTNKKKSASGNKLLTEDLSSPLRNHLELELESHSSDHNNLYHKQRQPQARRLSFFQSLLLRKWPYLAVAICIMSSLLFGILLSALTVYLVHDWTDCGALAVSSASSGSSSSSSGPGGSPLSQRLPHERLDYPGDTPLEVAAGLVPAMAALDAELSARSFNAAPASPADTNQPAADKPRFQRLPANVVPEHYDLFIWPHIAEPFNFTGRVSIRLRCRQPADNITLHALDLDINEKTIALQPLGPSEPTDPTADDKTSANKATTLISRHRRQLAADQAAKTPTSGPTATATATGPKVKRLSQDKQLQYSIVQLDGALQAGQDYLLSLDFVGLLNDDLAGFYKIKYDSQNSSEPTWIAATQFQATDARRSFPCFDEPLFKATFSIKIKHWKNMTALSNMPIINQEESQDGLWITDTFAKSHRMSTYLVAFAVTNFESRSEGNISVWTRPGFIHTADYALRIAGKILRHYEQFFGVEYPLPKMDMIALPDFNAGAMENWGLVTYRETAMLYDELNSSSSNKQRVATVVAHELAHQWFGNLVTPKWWDDLWLNEGFASFVEYIGVDHVEPRARMLDQFVVLELQDVLKLDGLSSSHQISIPVHNPDEITEIFDHISYSKGASVIRMMVAFLTQDVFKLGVQRYLKALKYNNAEQSDLWAHLSEAQRMTANGALTSNATTGNQRQVDLGQVMNSWTLQIGYPLVTLTRSYDGSRKAKLEQVRYEPYKTILPTANNNSNRSTQPAALEGQRSNSTSNSKLSWEIPITYTWKSDQNWTPNTRLWLHQNDSASRGVEIPASELPKSDDDWMIVNVNQVGYYRVNYDARNWRLLIGQLEQDHTQISDKNRAQIMGDIFELAKAGILDYKFAMGATKYLKNERDYLAWESTIESFSYINDMLQRTPLFGDWTDYISELIEPFYGRYKDMDWTQSGGLAAGAAGASPLKQQLLSPNKNSTANQQQPTTSRPPIASDDFTEHYNQVNAIHVACSVQKHCIDKAKSLFRQWRQTNQNNINPALRGTVYCTAIAEGNKDDWNFLWQVYARDQNPNEKARIQRALACSKEHWILARYLEWIFDKTKPIRRQDGSYIFREIANSVYGREIAFNFVRDRWPTIKEFYGKSSFSFGTLVRSVSNSFNTQIELNQLLAFYESVKADVGPAKRSFQIAIEEVEFNIHWRNRNYKILEEWLQRDRFTNTNTNTNNNRTILVH